MKWVGQLVIKIWTAAFQSDRVVFNRGSKEKNFKFLQFMSATELKCLKGPVITKQYCTVLYCTVLYCTVLYCPCTVLYLYYTALFCTVFFDLDLYLPGSQSAWIRIALALLRWKSQRNKIDRLAYRLSIDFSLLGLAYGFLSRSPRYLFGNHKHLTKSQILFYSRDFKIDRQVWIFIRIFIYLESIS